MQGLGPCRALGAPPVGRSSPGSQQGPRIAGPGDKHRVRVTLRVERSQVTQTRVSSGGVRRNTQSYGLGGLYIAVSRALVPQADSLLQGSSLDSPLSHLCPETSYWH